MKLNSFTVNSQVYKAAPIAAVIELARRIPDGEAMTIHEVMKKLNLSMTTARMSIRESGLYVIVKVGRGIGRYLCNPTTAKKYGTAANAKSRL